MKIPFLSKYLHNKVEQFRDEIYHIAFKAGGQAAYQVKKELLHDIVSSIGIEGLETAIKKIKEQQKKEGYINYTYLAELIRNK